MKYKVFFEERAVKDLSRIDRPAQILIKKKIIQLGENYDSLKNNIKKLKGKYEHYRLRVGRYRIIFSKDDEKIVIAVIRIGIRSNIYRD